MPTATRVSIEDLHAFCCQALERVGGDPEYASTVADALVMVDSWGTFTHGTKLLFDYVRRIRAGGIRTDRKPEVVRSGPGWAIVDGQSVMGHVASVFAMNVAIEKARNVGVAYVGVRNTNHFGAAGFYPYLAAQAGMIGISMANDIPSVAAPGSRLAVTGSNPLSYALPTGPDSDPILLDMAISTVAGGKVYAAHQRGESIPNNWIIDQEGHPTTDGSLYPAKAALQPMGGAKGYGIAVLIEALAGVLSGAALTWQVGSWIHGDPTEPTRHGAAFLAIDVATIMEPSEYWSRMRHVVEEIHAAPAMEGVDHVLLPGEREWRHRRLAARDGILLPADVVAKLLMLGDLLELRPEWLYTPANQTA
jgi:ureidoglycolate dehydrogenase (NAD+)